MSCFSFSGEKIQSIIRFVENIFLINFIYFMQQCSTMCREGWVSEAVAQQWAFSQIHPRNTHNCKSAYRLMPDKIQFNAEQIIQLSAK